MKSNWGNVLHLLRHFLYKNLNVLREMISNLDRFPKEQRRFLNCYRTNIKINVHVFSCKEAAIDVLIYVSGSKPRKIHKGSELNLFLFSLGYGRQLAHTKKLKIRHLEAQLKSSSIVILSNNK